MSLTFAEIRTAIDSDAALKSELLKGIEPEVVAALTSAGNVVKKKTELDQEITNARTEERTNATREVHEAWEGKVAEATGKTKPAGKKGIEWAVEEISAIKTSSSSDTDKSELNQLRTKVQNLETQMRTKDDEAFKREVKGLVDGAVENANLFVPPHLKTDEEKNAYLTTQRRALRAVFTAELVAKTDPERGTVFFEGDTALLKDGKVLNPTDIIKDRYKTFLAPEKQQQQGTGTGGNGSNGGEVNKYAGMSQDQAREQLNKDGHPRGSDEYNKVMSSYDQQQ
ncbi:hypothetical protein BWI97_15740 [Siphonobacter sp. BAB-5405]|uniref:hypothetical protein n=1 Tax=Siphonobacter sp. BAB-5405 TaxID=1864825 RepID=UPI000C80B5D5|nr:hypothetical protein [Siphonobacter sp. BAB-5405]PMD94848.1 hypothetical protein BWI97_15740 [Siphonobacter sp. BAB-5405]